MIIFVFLLQFLLTPPDEGPRVKGQRIKLQDIIEGMYNPLSSNNGCWISRKYFLYESSGTFDNLHFIFTYSWWVSISKPMGWNRITDRWKSIREDIDDKYNIREFNFHLLLAVSPLTPKEKLFQSLNSIDVIVRQFTSSIRS